MRILLIILTLLFFQLGLAAEPEFNWSKDFFGDRISGATIFPIGEIDGDSQGFVGATASSLPRYYINANGEVECHILMRYKNGVVTTTGNINFDNSNNCPLMSTSFPGGSPIQTVEAFGTDICIGGAFEDLGNVSGLSNFACYSPTLGWYQPGGIGNGPNGHVHVIEISVTGTELFIGGSFTQVNTASTGDSARRIIKTDGTFWYPLWSDVAHTTEGVNTSVVSILPTTSFLFAGVGNTLMSWNNGVPEWLDRGTHNGGGGMSDMVLFGSQLTAATRNATLVSGYAAGSVSDYSLGADEWSETGSSLGIDTGFGQLAFGLGPLYSSGSFESIDPNAKGAAVLINNEWQAVPQAQMLGDLRDVFEIQQGGTSEVCMLNGGSRNDEVFFDNSEIYWQDMFCYNGTIWKGVKNAPVYGGTGGVGDITKFQGNIIYAGDFKFIGDQKSNFVAKLKDNNRWQAISQLSWSGTGNPYVSHLQVYNGKLYATGLFDEANGLAVNQIAKWDGTNWSEAIPGFSAAGNSVMTVWNNKLVISGVYNNLISIITWDGTNIERLDGWSNNANLIDVYQGNLIAMKNGRDILKYNNDGTWSNFINVFPGQAISSLTVDGDNLYIGGIFLSIICDGAFINTNNIVHWDGNQCHTLGEGLIHNNSPFDEVQDIEVLNGNVIAMGRFDTAGSVDVANIAYWDGNNWNPMGLGLIGHSGSGHFYLDGNDLYISGGFFQAGDASVGGFAKVEMILDRVFKNGFE